jgi:hypothetical protein
MDFQGAAVTTPGHGGRPPSENPVASVPVRCDDFGGRCGAGDPEGYSAQEDTDVGRERLIYTDVRYKLPEVKPLPTPLQFPAAPFQERTPVPSCPREPPRV